MIEVGIFTAGLWIYLGMTRVQDAIGRYAFLALIALVILFLGFQPVCGRTPRHAVASLGSRVDVNHVLWGWWIEKHRAFTVDKTLLS